MKNQPVKKALLSVSDKTGLVEFAKGLVKLNIEIISSGGTFKLLRENKIPAIEISDFTGFPEMMDGRIKTLHPKVHGGILSRRKIDRKIMAQHNIEAIDLVVVNLYPFVETIEKASTTFGEAIENIDIGGPTMIRSAAKNFRYVGVVIDPSDYQSILQELKEENGTLSENTRFRLSAKAFSHTAYYESHIANFMNRVVFNGRYKKIVQYETMFPKTFTQQWKKIQEMRYGENPHQQAAFYQEIPAIPGSIANAVQIQGKPLSFNNIADADAAFNCVTAFSTPTCVIVKHANPCGIASAPTSLEAYQKAYATDPTSAFGGVIAFNEPLDAKTAKKILEQQFVEVIITPSLQKGVKEILETKPNVRALLTGNVISESVSFDFKKVSGGLLIQTVDNTYVKTRDLKIVSKRKPTQDELQDLLFAWRAVKFIKSNAIVYVKNFQTLGIGAGQMSRVDSAQIAVTKAENAGLSLQNAVMASDAFFPFRDGIDAAAKVGISAVIQPGGSMRDNEVIAAANAANMAMVFTGVRHFRH